jgi:hypothetical protein
LEKSKIYEKFNPGPGTYNYQKEFGHEGPKYTKYLKSNTISKISINKGKNLGPGEYEIHKIELNRDGKYTLSRLRNTSSVNFGLGVTNKSKSKKLEEGIISYLLISSYSRTRKIQSWRVD